MKIMVPLLLILPVLSAGCAGTPDGEFPSLAKRPFEDRDPMASARTGPAQIPAGLPADLSVRIAALERRVDTANNAFRALLPAARQRALNAKGSAQSSNSWVDAHIALSRLDQSRADAVAAASELDVLVTDQLDTELTGKSPRYSELMTNTQLRLNGIIAAQNTEIDGLSLTIGL